MESPHYSRYILGVSDLHSIHNRYSYILATVAIVNKTNPYWLWRYTYPRHRHPALHCSCGWSVFMTMHKLHSYQYSMWPQCIKSWQNPPIGRRRGNIQAHVPSRLISSKAKKISLDILPQPEDTVWQYRQSGGRITDPDQTITDPLQNNDFKMSILSQYFTNNNLSQHS